MQIPVHLSYPDRILNEADATAEQRQQLRALEPALDIKGLGTHQAEFLLHIYQASQNAVQATIDHCAQLIAEGNESIQQSISSNDDIKDRQLAVAAALGAIFGLTF